MNVLTYVVLASTLLAFVKLRRNIYEFSIITFILARRAYRHTLWRHGSKPSVSAACRQGRDGVNKDEYKHEMSDDEGLPPVES